MTEETKPEKRSLSTPVIDNVLISVSGSLAAMFLQRSMQKGHQMEIPSLGIKIEKKSLPDPPKTDKNNAND